MVGCQGRFLELKSSYSRAPNQGGLGSSVQESVASRVGLEVGCDNLLIQARKQVQGEKAYVQELAGKWEIRVRD